MILIHHGLPVNGLKNLTIWKFPFIPLPWEALDCSPEICPNKHIWRRAWGLPGAGPHCGKTGAKRYLHFAGLPTVEEEGGQRSDPEVLLAREAGGCCMDGHFWSNQGTEFVHSLNSYFWKRSFSEHFQACLLWSIYDLTVMQFCLLQLDHHKIFDYILFLYF